MKTLVALGDSWTYGYELEDRNMAWPHKLANLLGCSQVLNLGKPASSIYHLPLQIAEFEKSGVTNPIFFIGVTDESRYMFWEQKRNDWYELTGVPELSKEPELSNFLKEFSVVADTAQYREYYLGVILTWLQNYCKSNGYQYVIFKQFTNISTRWFKDLLDLQYVYNGGTTIMADLTDLEPEEFDTDVEPYDFELAVNNNPYFTDKIAHPCNRGHQRMAELLCDFYQQAYKWNEWLQLLAIVGQLVRN